MVTYLQPAASVTLGYSHRGGGNQDEVAERAATPATTLRRGTTSWHHLAVGDHRLDLESVVDAIQGREQRAGSTKAVACEDHRAALVEMGLHGAPDVVGCALEARVHVNAVGGVFDDVEIDEPVLNVVCAFHAVT